VTLYRYAVTNGPFQNPRHRCMLHGSKIITHDRISTELL
jgi:hypothetical protein